MNNQVNKREGFTIIEVVLVLAIAALIMLMVFIALPALQRSQRDTQRKDDISRLQAQISSYTSNNRGKVPFESTSKANSFINNYMKIDGAQFADPQGTNYAFVGKLSSAAAGSGQIAIHGGGKCSAGETAGNTQYVTTARSGAIRIKLEGGGVHCIEY